MSASHDLDGTQPDPAVTDPSRQPSVAPAKLDREPTWEEGALDPAVVEAAKKVFTRRRELLRRLA